MTPKEAFYKVLERAEFAYIGHDDVDMVIKALNELERLKKFKETFDNYELAKKQDFIAYENWLECEKELEALKKSPTADEVCLAIMKHYESKIVFYNEIAKTFNEVHLTRNEEVVSNYANGEVGINYNALPPHLITLIGKFYESLEAEK